MKEELLMNIENKKQTKKWRNTSIILVCFLFMLIFSTFTKKEYLDEKSNRDSIVEIEIDGIIIKNDYRDEKIIELTKNNKVKAVILNLDSPGGVVTPSEILYDLISKLNKEKPVVVLMGGMATSGAYMLSLGADYIIARNTTLTGSIGVLLQSYEVVGLAKKIGIELKTFKSSELKGMPSFFESNTEVSNKVLQTSLDDIYEYFIKLVKEKRIKITEPNFKLAINGQAFTGRQALKIGLIDEIGDKNSVLQYLKNKNIDINLPIIKVNLKKKNKIGILQQLTNRIFFNFEANNPLSIENNNLMTIYR